MRTWVAELGAVALVLGAIAAARGSWVEWLCAAAVLASFGHAQVAERMREREAARSAPEVHCWRWLWGYFVAKEVLWVAYFIATGAWAALGGCAVFLCYPMWRRWWRCRHPLIRPAAAAESYPEAPSDVALELPDRHAFGFDPTCDCAQCRKTHLELMAKHLGVYSDGVNYLGPRQLQSSGRWDYTTMNDGNVRPIGYCGEAARNRIADNLDEPAGHHATESEACACYKRYLMEQCTRMDGLQERLQQCEYPGCEACTRNTARVGAYWVRTLCDEHRTIAVVSELYGDVHTSAES